MTIEEKNRVAKAISRVKIVWDKSNDSFKGRYKTCSIDISRESPSSFYIVVTALNGCDLYDGYWRNLFGPATIEDAVEEALKGSLLI